MLEVDAVAQGASLPLLWRVLSDSYGRFDALLIEVRWRPFDETADDYAPHALCTVLSVQVDYDGPHAYDHNTLSGPALDDTAFDALNDEVEAWATYDMPRSRSPKFCADRMLKAEGGEWDRARDTIAKLEAEIAAKRTGRAA